MTCELRIKTIVVAPAGSPMFDEAATEVHIDDEASGEFIALRNPGEAGRVRFDPEDWPAIRRAINKLVKDCRDHA